MRALVVVLVVASVLNTVAIAVSPSSLAVVAVAATFFGWFVAAAGNARRVRVLSAWVAALATGEPPPTAAVRVDARSARTQRGGVAK